MGRSRLVRAGSAIAAGLLAAAALSAPASAAGGGTIQGTFTSAADAPIANAGVVAWSADQEWLTSTVTDAAGRYRLDEVTAGGVRLQFDDQGRVQWAPGARHSEAAALHSLAEGGTLTVDERQLATGTLQGRFAEASGAGAQAEVTVVGNDPGVSSRQSVSTDAAGAWSVEALPGSYKVSFRWGSSEQWAVRQTSDTDAKAVTVTAGRTTSLDEQKLATGTAGGRITDAAGAPLTGAYVSLSRDDMPVGSAFTADDGSYSFGEVLPGTDYTVSFSVNGGARQYVPGATVRERAQRFTIVAGRLTTIDDRLLEVATMSGRLAGTDGSSPLAGYHVMVELAGSGSPTYTTTGDDGRWRLSGVYPGDYRVAFISPDYQREQYAYGQGSPAGADLITVAPGASVTVDDTWVPGATLVVKAVDAATGAPVKNICVWVFAPRDGRGCSDSSQVTVENQPAGEFPVSVSPAGGSNYLPEYHRRVRLVPGKTTTVTVPLTQGGTVAITTIARATGAAVRDTCFLLKQIGDGSLGDSYGACSDAAGKSITQAIAAGTYELFAIAPTGYGHQWVGSRSGTGDQRAAARIVVKAGRTVTAPKVLLDPPGTITGVVSDATGKPLPGAEVAYSAETGGVTSWSTETDAQGRYRINKLGPYGWPLLFSSAGHPREWSGHQGNRFQAKLVPVVAGGNTTYNFRTAIPARLRGTVTVPSAPRATWRIHAKNAVTGDEMASFDSSSADDGGGYSMPLIGGQRVRISWSFYGDSVPWTEGWHDNATDFGSATRVNIPAYGSRRADLVLR
ncbi:hypothetical protein FB565_008616 [Actinoplanes lutulentus]|uniref:alpha-amylase n=1 Tax=Actinoplanes lutulentus TaxID=1287878 RepID=A0A327Z3E6_9ACTN|nr:carboxypeptidase regulatory-like domain-containing protein [Actinoplanes lutulentus]MBB2948830.1 hypothetical protein [Actinoplanes lutulentus]RAK29741.1 carboxypeptidase family protein [Actinoplanes lutulentus]